MKEITINGEVFVHKSELKNKQIVPAGDKSNPYFEVGKNYFIRTVTHYFTGKLVWVGAQEIVLESVAWIADTGRFNEFLKGEVLNESEPYPPETKVIIGRGSIIDASEFGTLPLAVK